MKYPKVLESVLKFLKYPDDIKLYCNTLEYYQVHWNISKYLKISLSALIYPKVTKIFQNIVTISFNFF